MRNTREKGITLIALIITIIVMLILVGVTVSVALNGGLFETARDAATGTDKARIEEEMTSVVLGFVNENLLADADIESLKTAVSKIKGITSVEGDGFPLTVKDENNNQWTIDNEGTIEQLGKWYELTAKEKKEVITFGGYTGGQLIADNGVGTKIVGTVEEQKGEVLGLFLVNNDSNYVCLFSGNSLPDNFEVEAEFENFKWYVTTDFNEFNEYIGEFPITKTEFEDIYCESYLDRLIENFNNM